MSRSTPLIFMVLFAAGIGFGSARAVADESKSNDSGQSVQSEQKDSGQKHHTKNPASVPPRLALLGMKGPSTRIKIPR